MAKLAVKLEKDDFDVFRFDENLGVFFASKEQIKKNVEHAFTKIFGDDLIITPETTAGAFANMIEFFLFNCASGISYMVNQNNVNYAKGRFLDNLGNAKGIPRHKGKRASVRAVITGIPNTPLNRGLRAKSGDGTVFISDEDAVIGSGGSVEVTFYSESIGNIQVPAFSLDGFIDRIQGVSSIINPTEGIAGASVESDISYRNRIKESSAITSSTTPKSLITFIKANSPEVIDVRIINNNTLEDKTEDGILIPRGSFWLCEWGGSADKVAKSIFIKSGGTPSVGKTEVTITDNNAVSYTVKFDIAEAKNFDIVLNVYNTINNPLEKITQAFSKLKSGEYPNDHLLKIGMDINNVNISQFLTQSIPDISIKEIKIGHLDNKTIETELDSKIAETIKAIKEIEQKTVISPDEKKELLKLSALLIVYRIAFYMLNQVYDKDHKITIGDISAIENLIFQNLENKGAINYVKRVFKDISAAMNKDPSYDFNKMLQTIKDSVKNEVDVSTDSIYQWAIEAKQNFTPSADGIKVKVNEIAIPDKIKVIVNDL